MTLFLNELTIAPSPSLTPMVRQYGEIKQHYEDCLLFFRLGDFYELFFDDALKAASFLDIALTKRGRKEGEDIPMCGIPFHAAESYIARLVKQGFKVAICEQLETPEEAKKRGHKAVVKRDVVRVITPGTLTEETLLSPKSANYLIALAHRKKQVSIAAVDISTGNFFREVVRLEELEGALARLNPQEILIVEGDQQAPELYECFALYKNRLTLQPLSRFDLSNGEVKLKKQFKIHALEALGEWDPLEVQAAGALVEYISLTQKQASPLIQIPQKLNGASYLQIDASTQRNLELVQTLGGEKEGSLLHCIDYTITSPGGRLLRHSLAFPFTCSEVIEKRLDQVEFMGQNLKIHENVREILKRCPDGERTLNRLSLNRGGPRDLKAIQQVLETAASLIETLESYKSSSRAFLLEEVVKQLAPIPGLENKIDRMIVDTPSFLTREGNFIRTGYLPELDDLRALRDNGRQTMAALQTRYIQETGISSLKIKFNNILGYYIDVTSIHKERIPASFIHRQTLVNSMRYTTPELNEIQEKLTSAASRCLQLELQLFQDIVQDIIDQSAHLLRLVKGISHIDLICGFAELARVQNYCRPQISQNPILSITKGRHPVIEKFLQKNSEPFVANSCVLNESSYLKLLTGPNMAGKSTFLRQNALIIILAQMGCFVPAESAVVGIVDRLYSRVGASDDLARGRSTFMMEMLETASILNLSTKHSFVVLDEMGRGTATYDGIALAWATLEYLHDQTQCRALFATHYHELTHLKSQLKAMRCLTLQIKEWQEKIIFLHSVMEGIADKSYGIYVAHLAGLPPKLITRAKDILTRLEAHEPL